MTKFWTIDLNDVMSQVHQQHPEFPAADLERIDELIERQPLLSSILRNAMLRLGADIVAGWMRIPPNQAAFVHFGVPTHRTLHGVPIEMAQNIVDDAITTIGIVFDNLGGTVVGKPAGSTDTVSVDNTAAFTVAMTADGSGVDVTPVQPPTDGATGTITYQNSMVSAPSTLAVVISSDTAAVSDHFDTTNVTTRPLGT